MAIDPTTTAIVLIEYQNDFTTEGGALHDAVSEVMDRTDMLVHAREVVDAARRSGADVVVTRAGRLHRDRDVAVRARLGRADRVEDLESEIEGRAGGTRSEGRCRRCSGAVGGRMLRGRRRVGGPIGAGWCRS